MANYIYSRTTDKGKQSFYLISQGHEYYLFTQKYYKGVKAYFHNCVLLNDALDISKSKRDTALIRTKSKLPMYIKYIERENDIAIMESTLKKKTKTRCNSFDRYELIKSCEYQIA